MTPDRFFSLMLLLERRDAVTTHDLAAALGVSLRTVTRDLNWLRDAGLPVLAQRGRTGGVTMLAGTGYDLLRLTPAERDQLSLTGLDDKQRADLDASADSRRAQSKLATLRSPRADGLLPLNEVVHVDSSPWLRPGPSGTSPAALIGSIRRARRLHIEYESSSEARHYDLTVDPYGLFAKAGTWYLIADCDRAPRMYRLERITNWAEVDRPRRIRRNQTLGSVTAALLDRWQHEHLIEVRATVEQAQFERAQRIFGPRLIRHDTRTDPTAVQVKICFIHLEDVRALLPFAGAITVLGPPEVRIRLRELADEIVHRYADVRPATPGHLT
ncbi:WYL domain-containing protein [Nocardia colli]|uniref:WYL domain-containing protein n=1 Tax=Nocardia colli TaxID=2545717 RepID=A0A5N0E2Q0_9NOCA|nr:WYL domain-containing protein [Nocardia colli]KAA8882910.1 WYL domain-containing protein [Nocardia colli]